MAKKKKSGTCGRCYWLWYSNKRNKFGVWFPLTPLECGSGCQPVPPIRDGNRRFEVVSKACAPKSKKTRSKSISVFCSGECEWIAERNSKGKLVWVGHPMCSQGCDCGAKPPFSPFFEGEVYLDFCVQATAAAKGKTQKAAKGKSRKKKSAKKGK